MTVGTYQPLRILIVGKANTISAQLAAIRVLGIVPAIKDRVQ